VTQLCQGRIDAQRPVGNGFEEGPQALVNYRYLLEIGGIITSPTSRMCYTPHLGGDLGLSTPALAKRMRR
jgi:hypothetical protein